MVFEFHGANQQPRWPSQIIFPQNGEHMSDVFVFRVQQKAGVKPSGVTYKMGPQHL